MAGDHSCDGNAEKHDGDEQGQTPDRTETTEMTRFFLVHISDMERISHSAKDGCMIQKSSRYCHTGVTIMYPRVNGQSSEIATIATSNGHRRSALCDVNKS
jgi:hypothetical protein